jgi:hypothetical protein
LNDSQPSSLFHFRLFSSVASLDVPSGTLNHLWASTADSAGLKNGTYCTPFFQQAKRTGIESDMDKAQELWQWTEREFKEYGFY